MNPSFHSSPFFKENLNSFSKPEPNSQYRFDHLRNFSSPADLEIFIREDDFGFSPLLDASKKIGKRSRRPRSRNHELEGLELGQKVRARRILWKKREDKMLIHLLAIHGPKWTKIGKLIGQRSGKQVRDRYLNKLRPGINTNPVWTVEEDEKFKELFQVYGKRWKKIAEHLPGRTESQAKNHYYTILRYIISDEWKKCVQDTQESQENRESDCSAFNTKKEDNPFIDQMSEEDQEGFLKLEPLKQEFYVKENDEESEEHYEGHTKIEDIKQEDLKKDIKLEHMKQEDVKQEHMKQEIEEKVEPEVRNFFPFQQNHYLYLQKNGFFQPHPHKPSSYAKSMWYLSNHSCPSTDSNEMDSLYFPSLRIEISRRDQEVFF